MNTEITVSPNGTFESYSGATSGNERPASWYLEWATDGRTSDAGVAVNGYTALTHCPLWQGVNIIAGDIGQIPLRLVKNEFEDQRNHPAWNLLRIRPNAIQTPSVFKETVMQWSLIWGNCVCWIIRRGSRPVELIPLRPDFVWPELLYFEDQQMVIYHYTSPMTGREFRFLPDEVVHIQGLTSDGIWGYPLHQVARNTIGHGLALERHGNRAFKNGVRPSGILKHPGKLSPEAQKYLRNDFESVYSGPDNSGKVIVLQEAMDFQLTQMTNVDAQWIEAKKLDRQMAASLLNLPAHKLNSLEDSSVRSNLEEQNADYVQRTLTRWFNRMSEEFGRKLLRTDEWMSDNYRFTWDTVEFLLGDVETTMKVASDGVLNALLSPNEARRIYLKLPPYKGGDEYGSPAINPRSASTATNSPPSDKKEPKAKASMQFAHKAHRKMLVERLTQVIRREHTAIRDSAKHSGNFLAWLDDYYLGTDSKPSKLQHLAQSTAGHAVEACEAIGIVAGSIYTSLADYAALRHKQLLKSAEMATQEQLASVVELALESEPEAVASGLLASALGIE